MPPGPERVQHIGRNSEPIRGLPSSSTRGPDDQSGMDTEEKAPDQDPVLPKKPNHFFQRSIGGGRRQDLLALCLLSLTGFHFAIPYFGPCGRRSCGNESAAIATLKNIASAQAEFRSGARLDRDGDGVGEFGYFADLAKGDKDDPPLLSSSFSEMRELPSGAGVIFRSGYLYQMFLPAADGAPVHESDPVTATPDANQAESRWCCCAWPSACPKSGQRIFFVDQSGVVREAANRDPRYSGYEKPLSFDATDRAGRLWPAVR